MLNSIECKVEWCWVINLYMPVLCTNVCHAYRADLKNSRVELNLNIDGDIFTHVHVAEAALDNHAGSVRWDTKLQKGKVTTLRKIVAFLFERCVYVCNAGAGALPLYAWWLLTGRTQGPYKRELFEHHSHPSLTICCSSHGTGLDLPARQMRISFTSNKIVCELWNIFLSTFSIMFHTILEQKVYFLFLL